MKNKNIVLIFSILFIVVILGGYFSIRYVKNKKENENMLEGEEYVPEEEIAEDQTRQTIVSLYFLAKENNELIPEARLIDIKEILNNPCDKLMELLIEGPRSEKAQKIIPEGTKLLKSYMEDDCIVIDLSSEFLNYNKEKDNIKQKIIESITNTLTQLTEVNKVKILIDGNENKEFNQVYSKDK